MTFVHFTCIDAKLRENNKKIVIKFYANLSGKRSYVVLSISFRYTWPECVAGLLYTLLNIVCLFLSFCTSDEIIILSHTHKKNLNENTMLHKMCEMQKSFIERFALSTVYVIKKETIYYSFQHERYTTTKKNATIISFRTSAV